MIFFLKTAFIEMDSDCATEAACSIEICDQSGTGKRINGTGL
jgi:hypothetical protein